MLVNFRQHGVSLALSFSSEAVSFVNLKTATIGQLSIFFFSPTCDLRVSSSLAVVPLASAFSARSFVLYFNMLVYAKGFKGSVLTSCLRVIRNAWHFWYAVSSVIKASCGSICIALLTP